MQSVRDKQPDNRKREGNLSKDGQWRSFPKVPNLLQYVSNGKYYGRTKTSGKLIRVNLNTTSWAQAKLLLTDFLKTNQENRDKIDPPLFSEAVDLFKQELAKDGTIKTSSKQYRLRCLRKIETTWPALWDLRLDKITPQACKDWAGELTGKLASHYFNNTIATLRQIIAGGIKSHKANGGKVFENPADDLKRLKVRQKNLQLPESAHFKDLVKNLRLRSGGWGRRVANLVEFLAFSGLRIHSEAMWVTWEDVDWPRNQIVVRGHPETGTKNSEMRRVPILPDMKVLLKRLKQTGCAGKILQVNRCNEALARGCKAVGISKLTHHDMRHLFATRCIESGVDIPTVSRWLGHKDGGALAMKTYGHLRNEHSQQMAEKVRF
jgi:integrase